jgi:glutathione-regulated potassium-efflux system ancillary protein KefG
MEKSFPKILVIFAHPRLESSRLNQRLVKLLEKIEGVTVRDLYELYPDYQIDVQAEQVQLLQHDMIIWHHPFYWYSAPPMIKMWIDEVLEHNWAYGPRGKMLTGKYAMNLLTAGGSDKAYKEKGSNQYTIRDFLKPFQQTARLCNMNYLPPFAILGAYRQNEETLKQNEAELEKWIIKLQSGKVDLKGIIEQEYVNQIIEAKL